MTADGIRVFLSYSRRDSLFVERLAEALVARGFEPIFDRGTPTSEDPNLRLSAQDEWWTRLQAMIAGSEAMVFVVSPDSAASAVCDDEIACARAIGKRVIAVLHREIDFASAPGRLRALNVSIDLSHDDRFSGELERLCEALRADIDWHREISRLARLAQHWDASARPDAQLLRKGAIENAEECVARRPASAPELGVLIHEFLQASRLLEQRAALSRQRLLGMAYAKFAQDARGASPDAALRYVAAGMMAVDDPDLAVIPELETIGHAKEAALNNRLRARFVGHEVTVGAIALSPDGETLVSADVSGRVVVWEVQTQSIRAQFEFGGEITPLVAFSPDGALFAALAASNSVRIFDAETSAERCAIVTETKYVTAIEFSADSATLLVNCGGDRVEFRSSTDAACTGSISFGVFHWVAGMHRHPGAERIVTASYDKTARVWDAANGQEVMCLKGHTDRLRVAKYSPGGSTILTGGRDGYLLVWDEETGEEKQRIECGPVRTALFSPEGARIASADGRSNAVTIWDAATGKPLLAISGHSAPVSDLLFSHDGRQLYVADENGDVRAYDAALHSEVAFLPVGESHYRHAALSMSSARAIVATESTVKLISLSNGDELGTVPIEADMISALAIDGEGSTYAVGVWGGQVILGGGGRERRLIEAQDGDLRDLGLSADGRLLVTSGDEGPVRMWSTENGALMREIVRGTGFNSLRFSPDNALLLGAGMDGVARIWSVESGEEIHRIQVDQAHLLVAAFAPDCLSIATASSSETFTRLWDLKSGALIGGFATDGHVGDIRYSACGNHVAVSSSKHIEVWSAKWQTRLTTFVHGGHTHALAFSPDARRLISLSTDGVREWDCAPVAALDDAVRPVVWLSAALLSGAGFKSAIDRLEPVMAWAPQSLTNGLAKYLSPFERIIAAARAAQLAAPLPLSCYLPLTPLASNDVSAQPVSEVRLGSGSVDDAAPFPDAADARADDHTEVRRSPASGLGFVGPMLFVAITLVVTAFAYYHWPAVLVLLSKL